MAELDVQIRTALEALQQGRSAKEFDIVHYIAAFQNSAYEKAQSVLDQISNHPILSALRPVFLSIGGGDGAELEYLLQHSSATAGMVIEGSRPLAEAARQRAARLSSGKEMTVFEGDAKLKIEEAVAHATSLVAAGRGDYVGVTCHAVLHELFDRGDIDFDPVGFFATIFEDYTTSTWFTYREPGVPEKWPEVVLVQAACDPHSLLPLAYAICDRHPSMKALGLNRRSLAIMSAYIEFWLWKSLPSCSTCEILLTKSRSGRRLSIMVGLPTYCGTQSVTELVRQAARTSSPSVNQHDPFWSAGSNLALLSSE